MQDLNSKSLEKVLAQQRKKEIAADDYHSKIENWLRLADQMLGFQATGNSRKTVGPRINSNERESEEEQVTGHPRQAGAGRPQQKEGTGNRGQGTAEKTF